MTIRWSNLGTALAVLAGLTAFGFATWPIVPPQGSGEAGALWGVGAWVIGGAFIVAAFLGNSYTTIAKAILFIGSAILIASAAFFGTSFAAIGFGRALPRVLIDLIPAILGLAAGFTIGPIQRSQAEIEAQQSGIHLPEQPVPPEEQVPFHSDRAA
jgi:hypothetical protein